MNKPIRQRTCIATKQKAADVTLLRVVEDPAHPGHIVADPNRRMPGRGAWITPTVESVDRARQRGAFKRALRIEGAVDVTAVREYVETQLADIVTDKTKS